MNKLSVSIIGGGNVAYHLVNALYNNEKVEVKQLCNRSGFTFDFDIFVTEKITKIEELKPADIYIIAVKDEAILEVSAKFTNVNSLILHTSGATDMNILKVSRRGVLYPLQSFSKGKKIDFEQIPIAIEAKNDEDLEKITFLAHCLSKKVYILDSLQRKKLHLIAVFANNFVNHLIYKCKLLCDNSKIPFEVITPLLNETFEKIKTINPFDAQTGPAKRGDMQTIQSHLDCLDEPERELYKIITNSILTTYGKEKL